MGKRTDYPKNNHDFYPTRDPKAVLALLPHLEEFCSFEEPCAGDYSLAEMLEESGHRCTYAGDIHPGDPRVLTFDAMGQKMTEADVYITNPPWTWEILDKLITHLSSIAPTWMVLNADVMHNKRMAPHMKKCIKVVSVGRVSWMNNGKSGMENSAWYLFDNNYNGPTEFIERI